MENYTSTDVYKYLNNHYEYLKGDLEAFHKLCNEAESIETENINISSEITQSLSAPTTTIETTRNPEGSEPIVLSKSNKKLFRLTIPITLSLFATIDYLGFLAGENSNSVKTNENFRQFFKQSSIIVTDNESDLINHVFRQGLSHVYFPKLNLGISYHSKNPTDKLIFKASNNVLTLNVKRLEEIVLKTFDTIKNKSELYEHMERKHLVLISNYQGKDGDKIANYEV